MATVAAATTTTTTTTAAMPGDHHLQPGSDPNLEMALEAEPAQRNFHLIDELESMGISKSDIQKLRQGNFYTIEEIAHASKRHLTQVKGISEAKAEKLMELALGMVENMGFTTGAAFLDMRQSLICITTGSRNLDGMLQGGVETGSLTELFGEFKTGKTQLCHTLAVTCQLPVDMGGAEGKCAWIDTENTFRPERICEIAKRYKLDPTDTLNNIAYARAYNAEQQTELLNMAACMMAQARFSLMIVDSAMHLLRQEYTGRGELSLRQTLLNQFLRRLQTIADTYGVAVVYTNQVTAQVDGMNMFNPDPKKPVGGNIMAHASTTRLFMRNAKAEQRVVRLYDSPLLRPSDCRIGIYAHGIDDPAEEEDQDQD